ncbi:Cytochrome c domain-containing protein [Raphanus sativus]|nr:Cytochrome c domain-containing protein [Raphanus sativus]
MRISQEETSFPITRSAVVTKFISKSVHLATPCISSHTVIWWVLPTQRKRQRQWMLRSRFANGGAYPPDLSLITKARHNGQNYVFALLTGYCDPPAGISIKEGLHYNPYFPGGAIAMPKMRNDEAVEYEDGTLATEAQMGKDVVSFLSWAAEPEMEEETDGFQVDILTIIGFASSCILQETEMASSQISEAGS